VKNFNFDLIHNKYCEPDFVVTITICRYCFLFDISSKGLTNREGDLPDYLDGVELDGEEKLKIIGVDQYD